MSDPTRSHLTARELEVLRHIADGDMLAEIAGKTHLSESTVKNCLNRALAALGARNRNHAVAIAYQRGILGDGTDQNLAMLRQAREMGYRIALVPLEDA